MNYFYLTVLLLAISLAFNLFFMIKYLEKKFPDFFYEEEEYELELSEAELRKIFKLKGSK